MNKILVSRIGEIVKRKLNGNRLFGNSFTTLQAVSLFPQRLETAISGVAENRSFCLLGSYPNPREQPRGRGWLRVRFTNAIVPASQEKTEPARPWKVEKRQSQFSPPSSDCGKTGKGLSGQFPNLVQTLLQILNVRSIDAPGFVRPLSVLVQIIRTPLEHGNKLAHILQIQPDTDSVQRHLADIGTHIQNASVLHFEFYPLLVLRRDADFQFFCPFTHCVLVPPIANKISRC